MRNPDAESFLRDVQAHKMTVLHEADTYRHIRFRKPGDSNMWFDLVTWPEVLTISGDMGTWTFSRVPDMFNFFRSDKLEINSSYWAEKLQGGVYGGTNTAKIFDPDLFKRSILSQLSDSYGFEGEELKEITEAVKGDVLCDESEYELMRAACDFSYEFGDGRKFHFEGCELPDGKVYCYHFLWCLYAIVWGIKQWDAAVGSECRL